MKKEVTECYIWARRQPRVRQSFLSSSWRQGEDRKAAVHHGRSEAFNGDEEKQPNNQVHTERNQRSWTDDGDPGVQKMSLSAEAHFTQTDSPSKELMKVLQSIYCVQAELRIAPCFLECGRNADPINLLELNSGPQSSSIRSDEIRVERWRRRRCFLKCFSQLQTFTPKWNMPLSNKGPTASVNRLNRPHPPEEERKRRSSWEEELPHLSISNGWGISQFNIVSTLSPNWHTTNSMKQKDGHLSLADIVPVFGGPHQKAQWAVSGPCLSTSGFPKCSSFYMLSKGFTDT